MTTDTNGTAVLVDASVVRMILVPLTTVLWLVCVATRQPSQPFIGRRPLPLWFILLADGQARHTGGRIETGTHGRTDKGKTWTSHCC